MTLPSPARYALQPEFPEPGFPDAFGSFRVLHQIGAGALGPVYRAYDPERDRLVAVKLFRIDLPPERVHQLVGELERLIGAQLSHPAIAAPLATGIAGASAYLVTEFVAAESLDIAVREYGPAPAADAIRVATHLAGALDYAAAAGVLHGALHPRDVLVSAEDTRLTGIGIVEALSRAGFEPSSRRPFAAPERAGREAWDRRADVFSLAVLIYEMLSGRRLPANAEDVADRLTDVHGAEPDELQPVFAKALARNPSDRFATALDFVKAVTDAFSSARSASAPMAHDIQPMRRSAGPAVDAPLLPLDEFAELASPTTESGERRLDVALSDFELKAVENPRYDEAKPTPSLTGGGPRADVLSPDVQLLPTPPIDLPLSSDSPGDRFDLPTVGGQDDHAALFVPPVEPAPTVDVPAIAAPLAISGISDAPTDVADLAREEHDSGLKPYAAQPIPTPPSAVVDTTRMPVTSALERTRSAVWPLVLALIVGLALGFAGGYGVGSRDHQGPQAPSAAVEPPTGVPQASAPAPTAGGTAPESTQAAVPPTPAPQRAASVAAPPPAVPLRSTPPPAKPAESETVAPRPRAGEPAAKVLGRVLVRSTPAGARVRLDGRDVGQTPLALRDLSEGAHQIQVVREGYAAAERRVMITRGNPARSVTIELARAGAPVPRPATPATVGRFSGALFVESRPPGANVFLDGTPLGTTPMLLDEVRAGEHAVRLERDGYRRWTASVRVIAGERNRVTASLER